MFLLPSKQKQENIDIFLILKQFDNSCLYFCILHQLKIIWKYYSLVRHFVLIVFRYLNVLQRLNFLTICYGILYNLWIYWFYSSLEFQIGIYFSYIYLITATGLFCKKYQFWILQLSCQVFCLTLSTLKLKGF